MVLTNQSDLSEKIESIKNKLITNYPDTDVTMIDKAYELANKAHGDQRRRSGEPYIIHPVAVADILADYQMDVETIVAALLHDVIEDTDVTYEDLEADFNGEIAYMVESVSKMTRMKYQTKEESQAEYIRKMVLSMTNDLRIIMIKLVDRLHNMRTLEYMSSQKQIEKSAETLNIYAPIANRLGIQAIRAELEDLSFSYLKPKEYQTIEHDLRITDNERTEYIDEAIRAVKEILDTAGIEAKVYGRTKNIYSIYRKMKNTGRKLDQIYDIFAVRIITKNIADCYVALGLIHTKWHVVPTKLKDYITVPKANGYQSLHTTVIGPDGNFLEIQIRTEEMHERNEYGVAAHWKYKEGRGMSKGKEKRYDDSISWIRQLINWTSDIKNASDFVETMKVDLLNEEIFVYTPQQDIINLPSGSCPVDFAYRIHTNVGNHCVGAKVNNRIEPLNYELKNGDLVEIMTSKQSPGPSKDWLNFVKSAHARNKINQFFKKQDRKDNIEVGRVELEGELKKNHFDTELLLKNSNLDKVAESFGYKTHEDLLAQIGAASVRVKKVIDHMKELFPEAFPVEQTQLVLSESTTLNRINNDILVNGIPGIETRLARCCNPIPGDEIIGYITSTNGISIHRADCKNVSIQKVKEKFVDVEWSGRRTNFPYDVVVHIEAINKTGGMMEILKPFYDINAHITNTFSKTQRNMDYYTISCEMDKPENVPLLLKEIRKIPEVVSVSRQ